MVRRCTADFAEFLSDTCGNVLRTFDRSRQRALPSRDRVLQPRQDPLGQVPGGLDVVVGLGVPRVVDVFEEVAGLLDPFPEGCLVDVGAGDVVDHGLCLPQPPTRPSFDWALGGRREVTVEVVHKIVRVHHGPVSGVVPVYHGPVSGRELFNGPET